MATMAPSLQLLFVRRKDSWTVADYLNLTTHPSTVHPFVIRTLTVTDPRTHHGLPVLLVTREPEVPERPGRLPCLLTRTVEVPEPHDRPGLVSLGKEVRLGDPTGDVSEPLHGHSHVQYLVLPRPPVHSLPTTLVGANDGGTG